MFISSSFTTNNKPVTARTMPAVRKPFFSGLPTLPRLDGLDPGKALKNILSEGDISPLVSKMKEESTEILLLLFHLGANALNEETSPLSLLISLGVLAHRSDVKGHVEYYNFKTPDQEDGRITQRFFKVPNSKFAYFLLEESVLPVKNRLNLTKPVKRFTLKGFDERTKKYTAIANESFNLVSKNKNMAHQLSMLFADADKNFLPKHAYTSIAPHPPNRLLQRYICDLIKEPSLTSVVSYLDTLTRSGALSWEYDTFPVALLKPTQSQAQVVSTHLPDGTAIKLATYLEEKPKSESLERVLELCIDPPNAKKPIQKLNTIWSVPIGDTELSRYTLMSESDHKALNGDVIRDVSEISDTAFYTPLSKPQVGYFFPLEKVDMLNKGCKAIQELPEDLDSYFEIELEELNHPDIQDILNPKKHLPRNYTPVAMFDFNTADGSMRGGNSKLPEHQALVIGSPLDLSVRAAEHAQPVILYNPELISDGLPENTVLVRQNGAQILDTHHPEPLNWLEVLLQNSHQQSGASTLIQDTDEEKNGLAESTHRDTEVSAEVISPPLQEDDRSIDEITVPDEVAQESSGVEESTERENNLLRLEDLLPDDILTADDVKALLRPVLAASKKEGKAPEELEERYSTVLQAFSTLLDCSAISPESEKGMHWTAKKNMGNLSGPAMLHIKLPQHTGERDIYAHIVKQSTPNQYLLSLTHSDKATNPIASVFISNETSSDVSSDTDDITDIKLALKRKGGKLVDTLPVELDSDTDRLTRHVIERLSLLIAQ